MQKVQLFIKRYPFVAATIVVALVAGALQIANYGLAAQIIITIFALGVAGKLAIGMVNDLRHGHYGVDILAILANWQYACCGRSMGNHRYRPNANGW